MTIVTIEEKAYEEFDEVVMETPDRRVSKNVHQRLAAAMQQVTYIQKDDKKPGMQYRVVTHDAVTAKVRPALLAAGIVYYPQNMVVVQDGNRSQMTLDLRFVNIDNPEDHFDVPCCGYGIDNQDKGPGKAISYCVKMGLLKTMGLETGEDPDLDQKTEHKQLAPDGSVVPSFEEAVKTCAASIKAIKDGIFACTDEGMAVASESWQELTAGEKMALWVAESKGGCFTTEERAIIKSAEFRQAHFGQ